jgi:hypothetical protein
MSKGFHKRRSAPGKPVRYSTIRDLLWSPSEIHRSIRRRPPAAGDRYEHAPQQEDCQHRHRRWTPLEGDAAVAAARVALRFAKPDGGNVIEISRKDKPYL